MALIKHARSVIIPVRSIDCDWNWLGGNGSEKARTSWEFLNWGNFKVPSFFLAGLGDGVIWVGFFSCKTIISDVFECAFRIPSFASLISIGWWAVDELLLWKVDVYFMDQGPWLGSPCGTEGPCRCAEILVFDSWDCSFGGPVNVNIGDRQRWCGFLNLNFRKNNFWEENLFEFFFCINWELIETFFVVLGWVAVVVFDFFEIGFKNEAPVLKLGGMRGDFLQLVLWLELYKAILLIEL